MPVDTERPAHQSPPPALPQSGSRRPRSTARRIATRAVLVVGAPAACVAAALGGIAVGGPVQDRLESRPTAAQERALRAIDAPLRPTGAAARDPRGPNRADLGGGRAELGAAR